MFLYDVYKPNFIKVNLKAGEKEDVFEELVDHFCHASGIRAQEEILDAIRQREMKMSTGIRQGIAIPHGKTNAVDRIHGALGISKQGIEYNALDGKPVYLLFLILAPEKDVEAHLRLLQRLAELLENPKFYTDLVTQTTSQGAHGILRKYEEILITQDFNHLY